MTTITIPRAVVEQTLEALEWIEPSGLTGRGGIEARNKAITALRAALAQQAEPVEPVAWFYQNMYTEQEYLVWKKGTGGRNWRPLYTAPPQRKPLTDEEIVDAVRESDLDWQAGWTLDEHEPNRFTTLVRAVERAHKIGEGA